MPNFRINSFLYSAAILLGLIFGYTFYWQQSPIDLPESGHLSAQQIQTQAVKNNKTIQPEVAKIYTTDKAEPTIENLINPIILKSQGPKLFNALFSDKILKKISFSECVTLLKDRFSKNYAKPIPGKNLNFEAEQISRVGLLKSFYKTYDWKKLSLSEQKLYNDLHNEILENKNEKFNVRVQAARNLQTWKSTLPHAERMLQQSRAPATILLEATKSEKQRAEEMLAYEK